MKTKLVASLFGLVLGTASHAANVPAAITAITPIIQTTGTGTTVAIRVAFTRGTQSGGAITLMYDGPKWIVYSEDTHSSSDEVTIPLPVAAASPVGRYQLKIAEISDSVSNLAGRTQFQRDGTISRVYYVSSGLPATHALNLAAADYDVSPPGGQIKLSVSPPETGRAINLSTRGFIGTGEQVLIVGISIAKGTKSFLFRAVGPTLGGFGVTGFARDPTIELRNEGGAVIAQNDNWTNDIATIASSVGAFPLPAGSRDAAIKATLPAGNYTLVIGSADGGTGVALAEAYELP